MKIVEKGPGMRSDRPGITPNVLSLEGSSHVLERERRELLLQVGGLVGTEERDTPYKSINPTPPLCAGADYPRYLGGPSASWKI